MVLNPSGQVLMGEPRVILGNIEVTCQKEAEAFEDLLGLAA